MTLSLATPAMASTSVGAAAESVVATQETTDSVTTTSVSGNATVSENRGPHPFTDVARSKYYAEAVQWAYENDIVNGTSATTFGPEKSITRGQIAVILWNAIGKKAEATGENAFSDVKVGRYYYDAVLWASEQGIASGTSKKKFEPNANTTRAQAISMLWRAYGEERATTKNPFLDVPSDAYYYKAVMWAYENRYTNGASKYIFGSQSTLTRGQFVTWLYNISKGNTEDKRIEKKDAATSLSTVYEGTDWSRVFNYEYYFQRYEKIRHAYGDNPREALERFVDKGMSLCEHGCRTFDVMSYYRANKDLRELYGQDWARYYRHYVTTGYKEERTAVGVATITDPITTYKGTDFSSIYDYNYYRRHYSVIQREFGDSENDQGAIERFVTYGLKHGTQAKAGVSATSDAYKALQYKIYPELKPQVATDAHTAKANQYSSSTGWLCLVDKSEHRVYVYEGAKGSWALNRSFLCGNGAAATPTPSGVFKVYGRKYYFDSGSVRCFYATMFYGNYYFHSTLYAQTSTPTVAVDDRVGLGLSHGCVRLRLANAKWIYDNIPTGTTVVVY